MFESGNGSESLNANILESEHVLRWSFTRSRTLTSRMNNVFESHTQIFILHNTVYSHTKTVFAGNRKNLRVQSGADDAEVPTVLLRRLHLGVHAGAPKYVDRSGWLELVASILCFCWDSTFNLNCRPLMQHDATRHETKQPMGSPGLFWFDCFWFDLSLLD